MRTHGFMQLIQGDLFKDFPRCGSSFLMAGRGPFHWALSRLAQDMKRPILEDHLLKNVFFDTCVYHLPGSSCC